MPAEDGTGPAGEGPMTGRGLGPCGQGSQSRQGLARGFRGRRFCGRGFGRGFGWRAAPMQQRAFTRKQEKELLQDDLKDLKEEIKEIEERISELEKD